MNKTKWVYIALLILMVFVLGCSNSKAAFEHVIHIDIDSKKTKGAKVYWRIESLTKEVSSTMRFLLGYTPYRETRTLYIPGLTFKNAHDVNVVIEIKKSGYYNVVERLNMKSVLASKRIGKIFTLYKKPLVVAKKASTTASSTKTTTSTSKATATTTSNATTTSTATTEPYVKQAVVEESTSTTTTTTTNTRTEVKDMFEPNDSMDKAKAISINRSYTAKMASSTDVDYYIIFLGARAKYKLILDQIAATSKYKVEILTHNRTSSESSESCYDLETASTENILKFRLKDKDKTTGIYCLKVSYVSGATGSYRLQVAVDKD